MRYYSIGKTSSTWKPEDAQTVTFIVTDDCNLRCKYCYITHKSSLKRMSFDTAKRFVDLILESQAFQQKAVILDFIGGEPLLEVDLIDKICDYFKVKAYELGHVWAWNYRINICTNGVNYSKTEVQRFIKKNLGKLSLSITIDGTKEKHDLQRVFPDGCGSFDAIDKNIDLWLRDFPGNTKVTFASADLPLLKDSIVSLWNRGIKDVNANVVFENVWSDGDDDIFEKQLKELADYIIDNHLFNSGMTCSLFDDSIGFPYSEEDLERTYCGAGKMIALSADGNMFPCVRYYDYSLNNHKGWVIGNIEDGINMDRVRPFMLVSTKYQSPRECLECPIASGCAFCQGFNYDDAETATNFSRATYICKMHKARVRANDYYFSRLKNEFCIERENNVVKEKSDRSVYILASNDYVDFCCYKNRNTSQETIDEGTLYCALEYSRQNFSRPIIVHSRSGSDLEPQRIYDYYDLKHIVPALYYKTAVANGLRECIPAFNIESVSKFEGEAEYCILCVAQSELRMLSDTVLRLFSKVDRINLYISDLNDTFDQSLYSEELNLISEFIAEYLSQTGNLKELNCLTDAFFEKEYSGCKAGYEQFFVDHKGLLYACPAARSSGSENNIGDIYLDKRKPYSEKLYKPNNRPLCVDCKNYSCSFCAELNLQTTGEVCVPPSFQCIKSAVEKNESAKLLKKVIKYDVVSSFIVNRDISESEISDPIIKYMSDRSMKNGFYSTEKNRGGKNE